MPGTTAVSKVTYNTSWALRWVATERARTRGFTLSQYIRQLQLEDLQMDMDQVEQRAKELEAAQQQEVGTMP